MCTTLGPTNAVIARSVGTAAKDTCLMVRSRCTSQETTLMKHCAPGRFCMVSGAPGGFNLFTAGCYSVVTGCKRDRSVTTQRVAIWFEARAFPLTVHPLPRFAEVAHRALGFTVASSGCVAPLVSGFCCDHPLSSSPPHHRAYPVPINERHELVKRGRLCRAPWRPSHGPRGGSGGAEGG